MGFNSAFKGLILTALHFLYNCPLFAAVDLTNFR